MALKNKVYFKKHTKLGKEAIYYSIIFKRVCSLFMYPPLLSYTAKYEMPKGTRGQGGSRSCAATRAIGKLHWLRDLVRIRRAREGEGLRVL